jgi:hypothetical protein
MEIGRITADGGHFGVRRFCCLFIRGWTLNPGNKQGKTVKGQLWANRSKIPSGGIEKRVKSGEIYN